MNRPRSIVLLAMAACLVSPGKPEQAVAGRPILLPVGTITNLAEPAIRQVVQRRDDNVGNIFVSGTYLGNVDGSRPDRPSGRGSRASRLTGHP